MSNVNHETLMLIFVAITGLAVLLQMFILLALFLTMRQIAKSVQGQIEDWHATVMPAVTETREFLTRVGPKVESVATDLMEMTHGLRAQSAEIKSSTEEILQRVRRQTSRMDFMFTNVLDTADRAGAIVTQTLGVPLKQISAIAAAVKAAFGVFRTGTPTPAETHSPADKDMFV